MRILQVILIFSFLSGLNSAHAQAQDRFLVSGNGLAQGQSMGGGGPDCEIPPDIVAKLVAKAEALADEDALSHCRKISGTAVTRIGDFQQKNSCRLFGTLPVVNTTALYNCARPDAPPLPGDFQESFQGDCHDVIRSEDMQTTLQSIVKALDARAAGQCLGSRAVIGEYKIETGSQRCVGFGVQVFARGRISVKCE